MTANPQCTNRAVFDPIVFDDGHFITADIWPDGLGFVMLRNPMGEAIRGFGFQGEDKAYEYVAQILEERERREHDLQAKVFSP